MKKILFILCVLFSTLSPVPSFAIVSHSTEKVYTPSVKKDAMSKTNLKKLVWILLGASVICLAVTFLFTVPLAKIILAVVGLGFAVAALVTMFKSV